jgi:ABC-2 type transport system ATP-binding protein
MTGEFAIETRHLEKVYYSRFRGRPIRAVSDLSLQVPVGVKFGLLGPNGAGKTTFVKLLLSAVNSTSGEAFLFGRPSSDPKPAGPLATCLRITAFPPT